MATHTDKNGSTKSGEPDQGFDAAPEFVREALSEEPKEDLEPITRLPELLAPVAVSPASRERLLTAVENLPLRYAPFYDRLSRLWQLPEAAVIEVLERAADPVAWRRPPLPGLELLPIRLPEGRPGEAYLARFAAGMRFPSHRHQGHEEVLVLEGSYTDSAGTLFRSGDVHRMEAGSTHDFQIGPGEPCVAAALHHGIEFSSLLMRLIAKFFA
jgi:quercetin dioxygenase-like cupin family protein